MKRLNVLLGHYSWGGVDRAHQDVDYVDIQSGGTTYRIRPADLVKPGGIKVTTINDTGTETLMVRPVSSNVVELIEL